MIEASSKSFKLNGLREGHPQHLVGDGAWAETEAPRFRLEAFKRYGSEELQEHYLPRLATGTLSFRRNARPILMILGMDFNEFHPIFMKISSKIHEFSSFFSANGRHRGLLLPLRAQQRFRRLRVEDSSRAWAFGSSSFGFLEVQDGSDWVLEGGKCWISNSIEARNIDLNLFWRRV